MKDEQFDREIATLYQQRKSQVVAPKINFDVPSTIKKYSPFRLLSILTVGGFASFGIMAVITHFATSPIEHKANLTEQHQVVIEDEITKQDDDHTVAIKPKLPSKPQINNLTSEVKLLTPIRKNVEISDVENIELNVVQIVQLPHLKQPEFLIKPIYKVMPKFSNKALQEQQSGAIRLRYEIDDNGHVNSIEIIESQVSKPLQRSAKKALAKWKYNPNDNIQEYYEIIFEFNPIK